MSTPPIISFDYDFSPYGQKTNLLLTAASITYTRCDVPMVLPRPQLEALGITYRRIPVLAIGKDVICDSGLIIDALTELEITSSVERSKSDKAYEAWGNSTFQGVLPLVPPQALTKEFVKDRETIFPILRRPDLAHLRPSALSALRTALSTIENDFLAGEHPYIAGERIGLSDVHTAFVVRWTLLQLGVGQEKGFGKDDFPRTWMWIESLPQPSAKKIPAEEAKDIILGAEYALPDCNTSDVDPLKDQIGKDVTVESSDADAGAHTQAGKLIGCEINRVVLQLENGVRLHFPRQGCYVKPA